MGARDAHSANPISPNKLLFLVAACLVWSFAVPGAIAACVHASSDCRPTFYAHQVRAIVEQHEHLKPGDAVDPQTDYPLRAFLKRPHESPRVAFIGFLESKTPYVFFAVYMALGLQVLLLKRSRLPPSTPVSSGKAARAGLDWRELGRKAFEWVRDLPVAALIFVLWGSWNLLRNFVVDDWGRTVFSFVHYDVSALSFAAQELRLFGACWLIAFCWRCWSKGRAELVASLRHASHAPNGFALERLSSDLEALHAHALEVGRRFDEWQVHSVLLTSAFLPWTLYYWSIVPRFGDARYYGSALVAHVLWGISWWLISSTTLLAMQSFSCHRTALRVHLSVRAKQDGTEAAAEYVKEAAPISGVRLVATGVASSTAFLVPLLGLLK